MQGAPERLRCEYQDSPLGIDVPRPRLSWIVGDQRAAELQTAYQILAASHPDILDLDEGDFWDTGRVEGRDTNQIEYAGKALKSGRRIWWKIRSFDSDGLPGPWSEQAFFEAGLLQQEDWQGRWIGAGIQGSRVSGVPVPLFAREFEVEAEPRSARLYVAALGQAVVQLNGKRLGLLEHSPDWVDYTRRVEYLTYDVGELLEEGPNHLSILLADGWYAGDPGSGFRQQYGDKPWLMVQFNLVTGDGREVSISSDSGWRWQPSWILAADPTAGESLDGRQMRSDWIGAGPATLGWYPVVSGGHVRDGDITLSTAGLETLRFDSAMEAREIAFDEESGTLLFAFAEPLLGRVRINLTAPGGGAVRARYGLELDDQDALVVIGEDVFAAIGDESGESFEALFSLHGFRYVELSGDIFRPETVVVNAVRIGKPLPVAATLVSDHPDLNTLHETMIAHMLRTQHGVPLNGLTPADRLCDVAAFGAASNTLLVNFDAGETATRWLRNMADSQFPEGGFPLVVPAPPGVEALYSADVAGSSDAFIEVLWQLYRHRGDRRLLRHYFPAVKALLAGSVTDSTEFVRANLESRPDLPGVIPPDMAGTAWFYRSARLAARIAGVLGNLSDLEDCEELASNVRSAFRRRFVTPDGRVIGDSVPVYALVLNFGLLDAAEQSFATQALLDACETLLARRSVDKDLLRVPFLLKVLTERGRLDLAYRIVLETPFVASDSVGGRDVGELVNAGVDEWLFATLSGFEPSRDLSERHNAFRHIVIHPRPPLGIGFGHESGEPPVRAMEAAMMTINGRYESSWRITDHAFELGVQVPGNCSAVVILPDGTSHELDAGSHEFTMVFGEAGDGIPVLREVS